MEKLTGFDWWISSLHRRDSEYIYYMIIFAAVFSIEVKKAIFGIFLENSDENGKNHHENWNKEYNL